MNKSILVLDTPKNCGECPICASYAESAFSPREYWCPAFVDMSVDPNDNPTWCPLKEVPEKDETYHLLEWGNGYKMGWNDCIDCIVDK